MLISMILLDRIALNKRSRLAFQLVLIRPAVLFFASSQAARRALKSLANPYPS
jgi:hypothetical protein